jgi:hypothetical protein
MAAGPADQSKSTSVPQAESLGLAQHFLLFALLFAGLMLVHAPLLRLPYFWDEAGYYVPAARDLYLTGSLIPHSTLTNAHPPLIMAWLALAWKVAGYSPLVTRTAMLAVAAFSLLGLWRLARVAANTSLAWATTGLIAAYPVFFTQSSLAQVDLAAAAFTFWGLAAYLEGCGWQQVLWFSLAALSKETAILAPVALFVWELASRATSRRWPQLRRPAGQSLTFGLLIPLVPLACWFGYHYGKTGFLLGNPEFFRYNVAGTLNPLRIPLALGMRMWQLLGYMGLGLLSLVCLLARLRSAPPERATRESGMPSWVQAALFAVIVAYTGCMSVIGGAVLARYMMPAVPLVILLMTSSLRRRMRQWRLAVVAIAIAFATSLFSNPRYGFSLEDNLAYRDYVVMHAEAERFLAMRYPRTRVLTAWPASDELTRPWLGYVAQPFHVVRIQDFTPAQIDAARAVPSQFDVAFVFSTKYQPVHPILENWAAWRRMKEQFFGYHRDLPPEEIAHRLGGRILFHKETEGQWVALIVIEDEENAKLQTEPVLPTQ